MSLKNSAPSEVPELGPRGISNSSSERSSSDTVFNRLWAEYKNSLSGSVRPVSLSPPSSTIASQRMSNDVLNDQVDKLRVQNSKLQRDLSGLELEIGKYNDKFTSLRRDFEKERAENKKSAEDLRRGVQSEAKSDRLQTLQILSILVGFFTFVSVGFQMFANVKQDHWGSLGLIIFGGAAIFVGFIVAAIDINMVGKGRVRLSWISILFATASLSLIFGSWQYNQQLQVEAERELWCRDYSVEHREVDMGKMTDKFIAEYCKQ